jgi:hypothetical protein
VKGQFDNSAKALSSSGALSNNVGNAVTTQYMTSMAEAMDDCFDRNTLAR